MGGSGRCRVGYGPVRATSAGCGGQAGRLAMGMTRQYLAGELSVLLGHLQAAATTEAATRDAWSLRHSAETEPIPALRSVTVSALTLAVPGRPYPGDQGRVARVGHGWNHPLHPVRERALGEEPAEVRDLRAVGIGRGDVVRSQPVDRDHQEQRGLHRLLGGCDTDEHESGQQDEHSSEAEPEPTVRYHDVSQDIAGIGRWP